MNEIISQGAEAIIIKKDDSVIKRRVKKSYRLKEVDDKIRSSRTKREIKIFEKISNLDISIPTLYSSNDFEIEMQYIDGNRLRDILLLDTSYSYHIKKIGTWLALLHDEGIIHGDLTTSNVLVDANDNLFLIDFGLSFFSHKIEDKAVDIHVFEQALESTHYKNAKEFFEIFKKAYEKSIHSKDVFNRLEEVHKRGKNK